MSRNCRLEGGEMFEGRRGAGSPERMENREDDDARAGADLPACIGVSDSHAFRWTSSLDEDTLHPLPDRRLFLFVQEGASARWEEAPAGVRGGRTSADVR
ncbi:hypothetical protein N9L68_05750 [bacterium]|nr:hypothetical protein [bacterium]